MMTRNSALDKFLLSRKFIVCIIVLQFILLPIATKGFRWENIGDLIIYILVLLDEKSVSIYNVN